MKKKNANTREITFYSKKCERVVSVFGTAAKSLAEQFENDQKFLRYTSKIPVEINASEIPVIGIRPSYIRVPWLSDFSVELIDGSIYIIEAISESDLCKRAEVEKLELSRRYWGAKGIKWKMYIDSNNKGGSRE